MKIYEVSAPNETKGQSYLVSRCISRSAEIQVGTNQGNAYKNELHVVSTINDKIQNMAQYLWSTYLCFSNDAITDDETLIFHTY